MTRKFKPKMRRSDWLGIVVAALVSGLALSAAAYGKQVADGLWSALAWGFGTVGVIAVITAAVWHVRYRR